LDKLDLMNIPEELMERIQQLIKAEVQPLRDKIENLERQLELNPINEKIAQIEKEKAKFEETA
jgi:predicted nuclease with TOPRIM domain